MTSQEILIQLAAQAPVLAVVIWHYLGSLRDLHRIEGEVRDLNWRITLLLASNPDLKLGEPKYNKRPPDATNAPKAP